MLHPFGIFRAILGHALRQFDEQPHRQHAEHQRQISCCNRYSVKNKIISRIHPRAERSSRKREHDCQCKV